METMEELAERLLKWNTGRALGDSGDAYGRNWERNQGVNFEEQPTAWVDEELETELCPTVSLYHWLVTRFELDELCQEFNDLPCDDWYGEMAYGLSDAGEAWLDEHGFELDYVFNSYNGEDDLSQVIQGARLTNGIDVYYLIQVHGGCDVRGGYTDAVLMKPYDDCYVGFNGNVLAEITRADGTSIACDNMYNGYSLTNEDGETVVLHEGDTIDVWLLEF